MLLTYNLFLVIRFQFFCSMYYKGGRKGDLDIQKRPSNENWNICFKFWCLKNAPKTIVSLRLQEIAILYHVFEEFCLFQTYVCPNFS